MNSRADRIQIALDQILPDDETWTECCDPAWRAAFPCGIAPRFVYRKYITVCTDQILAATNTLDDPHFEDYLDALLEWNYATGASFILNEPVPQIIHLFETVYPVSAMVLRSAADAHGLTLTAFLGADRRDTSP